MAVIVSLLSLAQQAYNPPVHVLGRKRGTTAFRARTTEHPDDETWPGLLILRPEGRLFFANAERVVDRIASARQHASGRASCCSTAVRVTDIEYTALRMLIEAEERLRAAGISPVAGRAQSAGARSRAPQRRSAIGSAGPRMFFNLDAAVQAYEQPHVA